MSQPTIKINEIEYVGRNSATDLGNIDLFFHAVLSNNRNAISTDAEGLERLQSMSENLRNWSTESIGGVGELLAYVEHGELSAQCVNSIGWLLKGLSELQNALADAEVTLNEASEALAITRGGK